jgi:phage terminase large subunit GpA-like protein
MARQGWSMSEMEIRRITYLLSETDLVVAAIAERMSCSKSAIMSINRRFQIRDYGKHRNRWSVRSAIRERDEADLEKSQAN